MMGWFGRDKKKPDAPKMGEQKNQRSQLQQLEDMEKPVATPPPAPPSGSRTGDQYDGYVDLQPPRK